MSLAIKFGDLSDPNQHTRGFIYLDATTDYGKNFQGRVTSHPIEAGVSVSDHFTVDNPQFRVSGVISGADLSAIPSKLFIDGEAVMNANPQPPAAIVNNLNSSLRRFLPDSIEQFIPNRTPQILGGGTARVDFKTEVEQFLETVMSGTYFNEQRNRWENRMTLATLYEIDGGSLGRSIPNLVMTNYSVRENAESGNGLSLEISLEQVRFATLESAEAPAPQRGTDTDKAASKTKEKGTATADKAGGEDIPNKDIVFAKERSPSLGRITGE